MVMPILAVNFQHLYDKFQDKSKHVDETWTNDS